MGRKYHYVHEYRGKNWGVNIDYAAKAEYNEALLAVKKLPTGYDLVIGFFIKAFGIATIVSILAKHLPSFFIPYGLFLLGLGFAGAFTYHAAMKFHKFMNHNKIQQEKWADYKARHQFWEGI